MSEADTQLEVSLVHDIPAICVLNPVSKVAIPFKTLMITFQSTTMKSFHYQCSITVS